MEKQRDDPHALVNYSPQPEFFRRRNTVFDNLTLCVRTLLTMGVAPEGIVTHLNKVNAWETLPDPTVMPAQRDYLKRARSVREITEG